MSPRSEPEFYRTVRRKNGRGYGPCDFEEFDRHSACSGHGHLGKIEVSCRFRFEESEWGLIGDKKQGSIIYMDVSFGIQDEHVLQNATIIVTLESLDEARAEEQKALDRLAKQKMFPTSVSSAHFTHYFGPHKISGRETETDTSRGILITPHVEVGGFGLGGMGWARQKNYKYHDRWEFTGQLLGGDDHASFRTLQWVLKENKLDSPSNHPNQFHTAFALVHSGESFFIRVQIQGKLLGFKDHLKQKLHKLKFGISGDKGKRSTLTLVSLDGIDLPKKQLLPKARGLKDRLEEQNGVKWAEQQANIREPQIDAPVQPLGTKDDLNDKSGTLTEEEDVKSPQHVTFVTEGRLKDRSGLFSDAPSIEELAYAHESLHKAPKTPPTPASTYASSVTAVERETTMEDPDVGKQDPEPSETSKIASVEAHNQILAQKSPYGIEWGYFCLQLLGIPFVIWWVSLFKSLSANRSPVPTTQQKMLDRHEDNRSVTFSPSASFSKDKGRS